MKLFTRYNRINLVANIAVFLVASVAFYFSIRYVLVHQIDEDLQIEEDEITAFVHEHNRLPESFSVSDQVIYFIPVSQPVQRRFSTVTMTDKEDRKKEDYRRLVFGISTTGQNHQAVVSKSLEGTRGLLRSILRVSIVTILVILLVAAVLNRVLLKRLWQPFYASLKAVQNFRPSKNHSLLFPSTNIDEFNAMNETLEAITKRSRLEYLSLKTFSENASHEIQTPIAIVRSKLDLLIQDEALTESQSKTLQSAYNAVEKLSRLNGSLLLLAKIENRQFEDVQRINLKEKLQEKLEDFQELWQDKNIAVQTDLQTAVVNMNTELADILLNNLLSNAVNHNYSGGRIWIALSNDYLRIGNTSTEAKLDEEKLFQRFYKPSAGSTNNGLGLSLIQQIAEASGFRVQYRFQNEQHEFEIRFHPATK
ncbi:sensor histidine kinase [Flavisolibacter ginsenosidimutans]|uniref:histidine kinase n=1 Tax=Flavisolibacter ginsenosidimutans TaxID=661481 RepID=A0A5B8UL46_9BACT|nr:HAMP domain-containing sensor histidine kinase [Flavisolibacter ginsenosidimutans]QEC57166.1 HAMP domain-containing histidine kinase [Flavisolibacter ginsenosidimutans]